MNTAQTYNINTTRSSMSSKQQVAIYTRITAGVLQIAIIAVMIMDGIEVRDINRFKYYTGEPYQMPQTKDWYLNRRLLDMNTRLGLLITLIILICLKQPALFFGLITNQFLTLVLSAIVDLICFVFYVVHLAAFSETFKAEASIGLVFSLLSSGVTGVHALRVRDAYSYD